MKLRNRLIIAFMVIVLVPILLGTVAFLGFSAYGTRMLEKTYGISDASYSELFGTLQFASSLNRENYKEISRITEEEPARFFDADFMESLNEQLASRYSYMIVRKNDDIVFNGGGSDSNLDESLLPSYGMGYLSGADGMYIDTSQALVKQIDFAARGCKFSVFLVTKGGINSPQIQDIVRSFAIMVIVILVITAAVLAFWLYQSIVEPLSRLSVATRNIKEGNLDFTMRGKETDDEIGQLYSDFEDMRQRLSDQAEERLQYDKENKELISNISHDLKTPITAIKGYVEGIMDGVADTPEKMDRYIRTIYNKSNDMDHLINELTFYSKIDSNRIPYTFNTINAVGYFSDCAEELELELEAKRIRLEYENTVDPLVRIIADAEQLRRVINNIVSNSIKYMDKEYGIIRLRVRDVGDFIQVDLSDNGSGISAKDLPHVFDRFFRTDSSRSSSKGGSGIGLSIVKKIIGDHGGQIWASSKLGEGTTMSFVIRKYQEVPAYE